MMMQAIGGLLPFAVAVALSPVPIIGVILVLGTDRARINGPVFALGWLVGLSAVSVAVLVLARGADDPHSSTAAGIGWVDLALGTMFLALAAMNWRKRPRKGEEPSLPAWIQSVESFNATKSLMLGLALSAANPKNLALTFAAATNIAQAGMSSRAQAAAVAVFVVLASLTVIGPVAFHVAAPHRSAAPLLAVREFMTAYSTVIMMVIFLLLGAKLIGDGLAGVWT